MHGEARSMDLADRYLNTRASVYFLKDGQIKKATDTVILFAREGDHSNLHEMQAMWWAIECGKAHMRAKEYAMALKKLTAVEKYFCDFTEDQFDFHSYCLRKMTLRTYVDMLRNAEKIRTNKNFVKIASSVIECRLHLHTNPQIADETAGMSEKELKKAKAKKAKADARAKEEAMKAAKGKKGGGKKEAKKGEDGEEEKKKEKPKKQDNKEEDTDPNGEKLLKLPALEEALKYVNLLQKFQPELVVTHTLAYDVYKQMGVPLAQLKSLRKASIIDATSPEVQVRMCDFFHGVESGSVKLSEVAKEIVSELKNDAELLNGKSVKDYNAAYSAAASSAPQKAAGARGALTIGAATASDAVKVMSNLSGATRAHAEECYHLIESLDAGAAAKYKEACAVQFPLATFFNEKNLDTEVIFAPETMWRDKEIEG